MSMLENCEPKEVFRYFGEICRIPHGSGNEKALSDYIFKFANDRGLFTYQDEFYNLVIRKPATEGYEDAETVIFQCHLDMVCEKNKATEHDFLTDPLDVYIDGDLVKARGTTLGADNGIAVAIAMAIMDSNAFPHPNLEFVLTSREETGLEGATALSPDILTGTRLINMDSEEEGVFTSSCAGGSKPTISIPIEYTAPPAGYTAYTVSVSGLKGGHSGLEIHKERGNANRIIGRILDELLRDFDIRLARIEGGLKDNAIPREAEMLVLVESVEKNKILKFLDRIYTIDVEYKNEYKKSDMDVLVSVAQHTGRINRVFSEATARKVSAALMLLPCGVSAMSQNFEELVETSNNIGVVRTESETVDIVCAVRSSVATRKEFVSRQIENVAGILDAGLKVRGDYPSWEYSEASKLRDIFTQTYSEMYNINAKVEAVHAGLECGLFAQKIPGVDMISFGPNMSKVHTPDECVSISSVARSWQFLIKVLEKLR